MRWCLTILPCILILLVQGVELCTSLGAVLVKDPSHLACILDDDNSESESELKDGLEREDSFLDFYDFTHTGLFVITRFAKTELVLSLEETEVLQITSGVRRHRWLCRESC